MRAGCQNAYVISVLINHESVDRCQAIEILRAAAMQFNFGADVDFIARLRLLRCRHKQGGSSRDGASCASRLAWEAGSTASLFERRGVWRLGELK